MAVSDLAKELKTHRAGSSAGFNHTLFSPVQAQGQVSGVLPASRLWCGSTPT